MSAPVKLGFVMLAHAELGRVEQLARYFAGFDCPVVIHIDRKTPQGEFTALQTRLADQPLVHLMRVHKCGWGLWSMVAATLDAAQALLDRFAQVTHVSLVSGDCLPLRPLDRLLDFLGAHPDTDFIESVTVSDVPWTIGGLQQERFTLRFPFSWRTRRKLFDKYVEIQRRLGVRRRVPKGLVPHLGSQWWCLTRRSLEAILEDPRRAEFERYFARVWIPDESYFQTLVRRVSTQIESRSLMLSKFDTQGKPFVFYDDHLDLVGQSDCFLLRKVWPRADRLYAQLLDPALGAPEHGPSDPHRIEQTFEEAMQRGREGRPGLFMQSRFPSDTWQSGKTAAPYFAFQGYDEVIEGFAPWLAQRSGARVHGHLFDWTEVQFAEGVRCFNGGLSDAVSLRDYNPQAFLTNLIWNSRGEPQCFQIAPYDRQDLNDYMMWDPNAHISIITGAWALKLFRSDLPFRDARREAAWMQKVEDHFLGQLRRRGLPSRVRVTSLAEFVADPVGQLQDVLDQMTPVSQRRLAAPPPLVDLAGFGGFLQALKNAGMKPYLTGDFPLDTAGLGQPTTPAKPYLVT
ncbi:beta-1,6-N-acetylglucosaminyltransferase [Dinoroseobacter sp. PD6]|uniref:DUF5927 domain-containing protein n=1 Tax=Dinoroseobacter sp. PD6 TaxID=3028384 RepID=UPI00237AA423|nr:beta-1,6-N-acetylglucosaminyltransferase [Dinoroseobacter sp. PD6]MDD9717132.1 beta-1,6-N-acetylglucosaminyltransferase [Dinoroseobacter sp. PD6]